MIPGLEEAPADLSGCDRNRNRQVSRCQRFRFKQSARLFCGTLAAHAETTNSDAPWHQVARLFSGRCPECALAR